MTKTFKEKAMLSCQNSICNEHRQHHRLQLCFAIQYMQLACFSYDFFLFVCQKIFQENFLVWLILDNSTGKGLEWKHTGWKMLKNKLALETSVRHPKVDTLNSWLLEHNHDYILLTSSYKSFSHVLRMEAELTDVRERALNVGIPVDHDIQQN